MSLKTFASRRPSVWLAALVIAGACSAGVDKLVGPSPSGPELVVSTTSNPAGLVISQVYGGGGNSGATYKNDFIELYNGGTSSVSLAGYSVQYASAGGTSWAATALSGSIAPGHYYLVQEAAGTGGTADLPTPDAKGTLTLAKDYGKVALVASTTPLAGACPAGAVDLVGFGSTASCFEGSAPTATLSNTTAAIRNGNVDTNQNGTDFSTGAPNPHNSAFGGTVVAGPLDHVVITGGSTTLTQGATTTFSAVGLDAANLAVPGTTITWASSDANIATVDNTGKVTGVAANATPVTLTATAVNGDLTKTATTTITITEPAPPAAVTVSPTSWSIKAGTTKQLAASALDAGGNPTTTTFTWSSVNPAVATVDASTGLVTGKSVGSTTIVATSANGKTGTSAITVTSAASLSLTSGKTSLAVGMQTQFFFSGSDASGTAVTSIVWSTSDASIITVDQHGVVTGIAVGTANLIGTAPDGTTATKAITIYLAAGSTTARYGHNTEFGEAHDADPSDDFIIRRPQYTVSYNPNRGGANWVSWNLDASHIGSNGRCPGTCYSADTVLTKAGLTAYTTADWVSGATYDRGHMAPSADWTSSEVDNNATFFLTNFLPQRPDLNQGTWEDLESALRDSVAGGREAYIIAGGIFTNGVGLGTLLDLGKIAIPDSTWKIAIITPAGTGLNADGTLPENTTVLAVNFPNVQGIRSTPWQTYITTIDKIQQSTGYDFLALLRDDVECRVEVRNCAPTAQVSGTGLAGGAEGQTLSFSAATSSDPDAGDVLTYAWSIDGQSVGSGATLNHTFADNGTYSLRLIVTDSHGAADTTTSTVTISNVAPSVAAFATPSLNEGGTFTSSGSFTDPGDDSWTATVDYGDGSGTQPLTLAGKSFTLSHTYADNGSYNVTVTVTETDVEQASGTVSGTVSVSNVSPTVASFAGATILRGETYASSGTFSDPGADTWTATVNYGDGSSGALALSGTSFALSHQYVTAGSFTAAVQVTDKDGGAGSASATVVVLSAADGIAALNSRIASLGLSNGEQNSLRAKSSAAESSLRRGSVTAALNQLGALSNELRALVQSGRLSQADADATLAYVERLMQSAQG